jgi:hypothetical protein
LRVDHSASLSFVNTPGADQDLLVLLRNGRDLEVMPAALLEQTAC